MNSATEIFEYQAQDPSGNAVAGKIAAPNEAAARRDLMARGLEAIEIFWRALVSPPKPSSSDELTLLVNTVGGAAANRLPIEISLAALAEELNDRRLAAAVQRLAVRMRTGAAASEAITELSKDVPSEIAGMLRAGFETGDLVGTMQTLAMHRSAERRIHRKLLTAIAYPLIIAAILVPLMLFLSVLVIPMFADLYKEFGLELPPLTELVLQVSGQMPMLVGGLLVFVLGIPLALRVLGGRWLFHRVRAAIPVVGPMWTWSSQREFAAYLISFLNLRLPMEKAVAYTGSALSDRNVGHACQKVVARLEDGQMLGPALSHSIHFDRSLTGLVTWGEHAGFLREALEIAVYLFDDRIEQQATLLRRLLPPVTMVLVASIMFFMLLGLMIPMVKLIEGLSQ